MKNIMEKYREKLRSKRKGVTPVIAIVLLLMMTVAAAGMAYVFIQQVQNDAMDDAQGTLDDMRDTTALSLKFETVTNSSGNISVTLRNNGKRGISSSELEDYIIYVDKTMDSNATGNLAECDLSAVGDVCTVGMYAHFPLDVGDGDAKLVEVVAPMQDKTFAYTCIKERDSDTWC